MMRFVVLLAALYVGWGAFLWLVDRTSRWPTLPTYQGRGGALDALVEQVSAKSCTYHISASLPTAPPSRDEAALPCKRLKLPAWWNPVAQFRFGTNEEYSYANCSTWASKCLGRMGQEARSAVPGLITALTTAPEDRDTGDGAAIPKTALIRALGAIGDRRAVVPLQQRKRALDAQASHAGETQAIDDALRQLGAQ